ncbi:TadA family conjugal transfer-associated ATPase [Desertivibrio insolitus]|uniref:TadA family conjugal transfer-associated ATPase n=1 Tax=Herbiconiux sp. SYSU D00978 TaxID=2812562 RepID=UPI001A97512E|nr:TadA family conjugal transfer-associated ATPase [Herbiconiux sp. SYSU D00978]
MSTAPVPAFVARRPGQPDDAGPPRRVIPPPLLTGTLERVGRLLEDPDVTDVFLNGGAGGCWVDRGSGAVLEGAAPAEPQLRDLAVRLIALGGRHIDEATPAVDVHLADGIRVHAVLPPIAPRGTLVSIRAPRPQQPSLDDLTESGTVTPDQGALLRGAIEARRNVLITGGGGCGKTTLLAALLGLAAPGERIVAIEDVAELRVAHPHYLSLETRQANLEGAGEIGLVRLVREALRMRPDRLVLGEVRGAEVRELLAALNTGHEGGAGTLHANSLNDVPARLEALGALAGMSAEAVARQAVSALHLVLHLERREGRRTLAAVGRLALEGDRLVVEPLEPAEPGPPPEAPPPEPQPLTRREAAARRGSPHAG